MLIFFMEDIFLHLERREQKKLLIIISGQNKIKDVKLWFNKSKGMSKDIFSDQNWDSSIKLISQNEI